MVEQELFPPVFRFDDFEVDVAAATLSRSGRLIKLQEKPFQILVTLLASGGSLVTRQELCERLWPDEEFGQFDDRLNTAVLKLRQVLDDSASTPRYIETVPRRGYRFLASVESSRSGDVEVEADDTQSAPNDSTGWRAAWLSFAVAVFILVFWFVMQREAIPFSERDWAVITELENTTGDEVFDRSLRTALTIGIRQSRYVNVLPEQRIREALQRMGQDPSTRVTEGVGAEIAGREGARLLIVGSVSQIGEVYELAARLVDPGSLQDVAVETARASSRDQVVVALDGLVEDVRARLGESSDMITAARVPLPRATTSSLEALKLYAEATALLWDTGEQTRAVEDLEQAVALDPDFALAHLALGSWFYTQHDRVRGEEHFEYALERVDRLTVRERLWLEADVEGWRGNTEAAIGAYQRFLNEYPDTSRAWYRLGYQYLTNRDCENAEQAYRRVLELDTTSAGSWINIATCQAHRGQYDEAILSYNRAFEAQPDIGSSQIQREYATVLVMADRAADAAEVFEVMLAAENRAERAMGHRGGGFLALLEGRVAAAIEEFRAAISMSRDLGDKTAVLRLRVFVGLALRLVGDEQVLGRELDLIEEQLETDDFPPYFTALAGKLLAREGRSSMITPLLERVTAGMNRGNPYDQAGQHLLAGEIALSRNDLNTALQEFEHAVESHREPYYLESLAFTLAKSGRVEESLAVYEEILAKRWFGYEAQFVWMWTPFNMAQIEGERGNAEAAEELYRLFVDQWSHPDEEIVDLAAARKWLHQ